MIPLELFQKRSVQIVFGIPKPVAVKQRFCFLLLRDIPKQSADGTCICIIDLHECTALRGEVFLHPASGFYDRTLEVMLPFLAIQISEYSRLTWIYHKWIEPASQGFCILNSATVFFQKNTGNLNLSKQDMGGTEHCSVPDSFLRNNQLSR